MAKTKKLLQFVFGSALMAAWPMLALAASTPPPSEETKLAKPLGSEVLPGGQIYQTDFKTSAIFSKVIPFAIKTLVGLATALAVIALMVGGYQYLTAYGDTTKHQQATKTLTWAILGLILSITAYAIVALVTSFKFGGA